MKTLILIFLITINFSMYAQKSTYVRVYNSSGVKISKGHVLIITDSALMLAEHQPNFIPVSSIGYLKTKHSAGNNVLIGSAVGLTAGIISGLATPNSNYLLGGRREGSLALGGALTGGLVGAGIGGLSSLLKKSKTYFINGDITKWKAFQLMLFNNTVK